MSVAGLTVLFAAVAGTPAAAQTPERFRADASGNGLEVGILGLDPLELGSTDASGSGALNPVAEAGARGVSLLETSHATALADADGESVRDPSSDSNCALPTLPDPVGSIVQLEIACANAAAQIASNLPSSQAVATGGSLGLGGTELANVLTGLVLDPVEGTLGSLLGTVELSVLDSVLVVVSDACDTVLADLAPTVGTVGDLTPGELLDVVDTVLEPAGAADPCQAVLDLTTSPPAIASPDDVIAELTNALVGALEDLDLLEVTLAQSASGVDVTGTAATSVATATGLRASLPSLAFLTDLVSDVLEGVVGDFLGDVTGVVGPVEGAPAAVPAVGPLVSSLLGDLDAPLLNADEPLLTIEVADSSVSAVYNRATGTATASGIPGTIEVTVNSGLSDLLNVDETLTVAPGVTLPLLEGTPLESVVSAGAFTSTDDEVDGLPGVTGRVTGVTLALLTGLDGGITVDLAGATASARGLQGTEPAPVSAGGGPAVPAPEPAEPAPQPVSLPRTGGGLGLIAVALSGLGALMWRGRRS